MNIFVIGDVHGCYNTFRKLINYWNPQEELLIQLGDLIDRGNFVPETIQLAKEIQARHPSAVFLKGNHESLAIQHQLHHTGLWYERFGKKVLWQYQLNENDFGKDVEWFKKMPLYWENDFVFISHAGICNSSNCLDELHEEGILWNRSPLKNIGKIQIIGHTPQKQITFTECSNSWNIDTGAYMGKKLSGIKLTPTGELLEKISIPTLDKDVE